MVPCILIEDDWTDLRDQERRPRLEVDCNSETIVQLPANRTTHLGREIKALDLGREQVQTIILESRYLDVADYVR